MRKQPKLEMIGDADLDRVIGGTGVAQIGSDWMVGGVIGAQSMSSFSSLSSQSDVSRASHNPGFVGILGFLPAEGGGSDASDLAPANAGQFTEEPQEVDSSYADGGGCGGGLYGDYSDDQINAGLPSDLAPVNAGQVADMPQDVEASSDHGGDFSGYGDYTSSEQINAGLPSDLTPVNAGQFIETPQDVEATDDYGDGDDGGCGGGDGDGGGGGNGDGMGGGGGDGGGDGDMGIMTCGFQDNDMPMDPEEALDQLIDELGGCGDGDDEADPAQQGNDQLGTPDPAAIAPQPGLGQLR
jgi:hypothetical protein